MKSTVKKLAILKGEIQLTLSIDREKYTSPDDDVVKIMTIALLSGTSCNAVKQLFNDVDIDLKEIERLQHEFSNLVYEVNKAIKSKCKMQITDKHTFI